MEKIDKTDSLKVILTRGKFEVDYYQREYRWGRKNIEQMIMDFSDTFHTFYDKGAHQSTAEVQNYGYYYMGSIICTNTQPRQIIDGQQRLTSLTLLLIYLRHLQNATPDITKVSFDDLIYQDDYGNKAFNLDVPERNQCMHALWDQNTAYIPDNESNKNLLARYADIEELFPDDLKEEVLPYYIYWLIGKVLLLEIDTPSEDEAHTIFLTMNDRGLSLNSAEMLKAYIIQQVEEKDRDDVNRIWQHNINQIKNAYETISSGTVKAEDVDFISTWLRSRYAKTLRDTKKGSEDKDFELLGEKFHNWVRQNAKAEMGLTTPKQFKELITIEMTMMTKLYLRIKEYSENFTKSYEAVYYNAHRDINYQYYLIMSSVCVGDAEEIIDKKIKMVSSFVDIFASTRIFNYKKVNWNTNKTALFRTLLQIRNQDIKTIGIRLTSFLQNMNEKLDYLQYFELNQFTGRYMLHMLARLTDYVYARMGYSSMFPAYIDRNPKTSYDIEHILPDDYPTYSEMFNDEEDFRNNRRKIGNLIILTSDHNRSYQDMPYEIKVQEYLSDNILAQSLNEATYEHNPKFLALQSEFGFKAYPQFNKDSIRERMLLYTNLSKKIWRPGIIRELAGGWEDDEVLQIESSHGQKYTVEYGDGRSWKDAEKYGFVSASSSDWNKLQNLHIGDYVFCHIAHVGFVGVGICTSVATKPDDFTVEFNGQLTPVLQCEWIDEEAKSKITDKELFVGVKWYRTVPEEEGYWETGMTSLPMVAYQLNDSTTHDKVLKHLGIEIA